MALLAGANVKESKTRLSHVTSNWNRDKTVNLLRFLVQFSACICGVLSCKFLGLYMHGSFFWPLRGLWACASFCKYLYFSKTKKRFTSKFWHFVWYTCRVRFHFKKIQISLSCDMRTSFMQQWSQGQCLFGFVPHHVTVTTVNMLWDLGSLLSADSRLTWTSRARLAECFFFPLWR